MRVLLIDDSTTIHKVIRLGLGAFPGAILKICESIDQARQEFSAFAPQVVIGAQTVGGQSCGKDYLELCGGRANVIALADHSEGEGQLRKLGYLSILRKPFTLGEFRDLLGLCAEPSAHSEFNHEQQNEDTAQIRFQSGMNVAEVESAFRETLELMNNSSHQTSEEAPTSGANAFRTSEDVFSHPEKAFQHRGTDLAGSESHEPALTINLKELEGSLQKSLLGEVYVPQVSQVQAKLIDEHVAKTKAQKLSSVIGSAAEADVQTIRQPESEMESFIIEDVVVHSDGQRGGQQDQGVSEVSAARQNTTGGVGLSESQQVPRVAEPYKSSAQQRLVSLPPVPKPRAATVASAPETKAESGGVKNAQEVSSALLLEEYKRVQIERQIKDEISGLETRVKSQLRLELETQFMQSVEGLVKPQIDAYLNKQWPTVVKSITLQVKKSVETEYTSRMHTDLIQMQKRLALELKAELRTEVQNALRNWMGSYSRDILKEVAREELQKLLESV